MSAGKAVFCVPIAIITGAGGARGKWAAERDQAHVLSLNSISHSHCPRQWVCELRHSHSSRP